MSAKSSSKRANAAMPTGDTAPLHGAEPRVRKRSAKSRTRPQGRRKMSPPPAPAEQAPPPMPIPAKQPSLGPASPVPTKDAAPSSPHFTGALETAFPEGTNSTPRPTSTSVFAEPFTADTHNAGSPLPPTATEQPPSLPPLPNVPLPQPHTSPTTESKPFANATSASSLLPSVAHEPDFSMDKGTGEDMDDHNPKHDSFFSTGAAGSARNSFFSTGADSLQIPSPPSQQDLRQAGDQNAELDAFTPEQDGPKEASILTHSPETAASARAEHLAALKLMPDEGLELSGAPDALDEVEDLQTSVVDATPMLPLSTPTSQQDASDSCMTTLKEAAVVVAPLEEQISRSASLNVRRGDEDEPPTAPYLLPGTSQFDNPPCDQSDDAADKGGLQDNATPLPLALTDEPQAEVDMEFWSSVSHNTEPARLARAVQFGIPAEVRGAVWQELSASRDPELESKFAILRAESSEHDKAIQRDLARTYPEQTYFQDASQGQQDLFDVVKAYALFDDEVGYCQGMQFIIGPLLFVLNAPQAFLTLVALMQKYDLRAHFLPGMPGLQLRLYQFERMMEERLPKLYTHLARSGVKPNMYASPWFMTLFCYQFPLAVAYRVLDTIFAEGLDALFGFVLALLTTNEAELLTLDFEDAVLFLKHNVFHSYRLPDAPDLPDDPRRAEGDSSPVNKRSTWTAERYAVNRFAREAAEARELVRADDLVRWAEEYHEMQQKASAPAAELEELRQETWKLAAKVKELEENAALQGAAHSELAKQVVAATLAKDEVGEQLVRYKTLYAEVALAQAQQGLAPPRPSPSHGKNSQKGSSSPAMPASTPMEHTYTASSHASTTSVSAATSNTNQSTATTNSDHSVGGGASTVAQSVSATVASWGRWISRAKTHKATATAAAESKLAPQESPADDASHAGDTSHAESLGVLDSASAVDGHGPPPPLPPRKQSPLPPKRQPRSAGASTPPSQHSASPHLDMNALEAADMSAASVTPSEAETKLVTTAEASAETGTEDRDKTPSGSPVLSHPPSPSSAMESVPLDLAS